MSPRSKREYLAAIVKRGDFKRSNYAEGKGNQSSPCLSLKERSWAGMRRGGPFLSRTMAEKISIGLKHLHRLSFPQ
jgi:hypothetical protein